MPDITMKKLQEAYKKIDESSGGITPVKPGTGNEPKNKPVARDEGAQTGAAEVKEFAVSGQEDISANPVKREEGAKPGSKEVGEEHGAKGDTIKGKAKSNSREEGSAAGAKEVGEYKDGDFRGRIRQALGLPLDDKLNKVGDGLGKGHTEKK